MRKLNNGTLGRQELIPLTCDCWPLVRGYDIGMRYWDIGIIQSDEVNILMLLYLPNLGSFVGTIDPYIREGLVIDGTLNDLCKFKLPEFDM